MRYGERGVGGVFYIGQLKRENHVSFCDGIWVIRGLGGVIKRSKIAKINGYGATF